MEGLSWYNRTMKYTVKEYATKGGSKGLILNVKDAPVVCMDFNFLAGYRYADDYQHKAQVAHVLEHVAAGSSEKIPSPMKFEQTLKKNGAYSNAYTGPGNIGYVATCADFEWQRVMGLIRDEICHPALEEKKFQSELGNVRSELTANLSNSWRMLDPLVSQRMGEQIMTYPEYIKTLDNITLNDVKAHHKKTHFAENMRFVVAGDFTGKMDAIKAELDAFDLPSGRQRFTPLTDRYHATAPVLLKREDVPGISFTFNMITPRQLTDDEGYAMDALNRILSGTMNSRIFGQARERGLLYDCSSSTWIDRDNSGWLLYGKANNNQLPAVFDLIVQELRRVTRGEVDGQDLADAKSYSLGRFRMGIQTVEQLMGYMEGRYFYDGTIKRYSNEPKMIEAVSKEMIVRLAREFFQQKTWAIGLYGTTDQAMADNLQEKLSGLF